VLIYLFLAHLFVLGFVFRSVPLLLNSFPSLSLTHDRYFLRKTFTMYTYTLQSKVRIDYSLPLQVPSHTPQPRYVQTKQEKK